MGEILFTLKAGSTRPHHVRELHEVGQREDAVIGALLFLR